MSVHMCLCIYRCNHTSKLRESVRTYIYIYILIHMYIYIYIYINTGHVCPLCYTYEYQTYMTRAKSLKATFAMPLLVYVQLHMCYDVRSTVFFKNMSDSEICNLIGLA